MSMLKVIPKFLAIGSAIYRCPIGLIGIFGAQSLSNSWIDLKRQCYIGRGSSLAIGHLWSIQDPRLIMEFSAASSEKKTPHYPNDSMMTLGR